MLNPTFDGLYTDLINELDRYATARNHGDLDAAFTSRGRLAEIRHLLAIERSSVES